MINAVSLTSCESSSEFLPWKNLARAVIEEALGDCRRPRICTECGHRMHDAMEKLRNDAERFKRGRRQAYQFLIRRSRIEMWAKSAQLDMTLLAKGAKETCRAWFVICGAEREDQMYNCPYGKGMKGKKPS